MADFLSDAFWLPALAAIRSKAARFIGHPLFS